MRIFSILVVLCLAPGLVLAQQTVPVPFTNQTFVFSGVNFFIALISGLILAVAFELLLTNLSVAAGLNVLGPIKPGGGASKSNKESTSKKVFGTMDTVTNTFGVWTLITASIALFFASWLAVSLSLITNAAIGAVLALVIWGLFYVFMMTFETSVLTSLVGTMTSLAKSGFSSASNAVASIVSKSPEQQIADISSKVVSQVRDEVFGDVDVDQVKDDLTKMIKKFEPPKIDAGQIKNEIRSLLDDTELRAITQHEGPLMDKEVMTARLQEKGAMDLERAQSVAGNIQDALSKIKEEAGAGKDTTSAVVDSAMRVAGLSPEDTTKYRSVMEDYLRRTNRAELNPEGIKSDLEKLFSDPKAGLDALKSRLSMFDANTLKALIAQRKDVGQDDANKIVDTITSVINQMTGQVSDKGNAAASAVDSATQAAKDSVQGVINRITGKVRDYLDSLNRPELRYEGLQHDFRQLFTDPKAGADALLKRLKSVDRNTLKALLSSRSDISENDAEGIISRIESTRDELVQRVNKMRDEVETRLQQARDEIYRQGEELRKLAASAAWWALGSATVSGAAAMVGGFIGAGVIR